MDRSSVSIYDTNRMWREDRPHVLVVACSDGRLQTELDMYLTESRGVVQYDRLYLPGGPGALASSGIEFARSERHREEFKFLMVAHGIEEVIFVFHGPSEDGPPESACADYRRFLGSVSNERIREEQMRDAKEVLRMGMGTQNPKVSVIYCEVGADRHVRFRELDPKVIANR